MVWSGTRATLSGERLTFGKIVYHSGETFFTLGYGDIVPTSWPGASAFGAGIWNGVRISRNCDCGYIPVVYSAFSRREIQISQCWDARAGSPPTAVAELLVRLAGRSEGPSIEQILLDQVLRDWERWSAELLESRISYPVLSFFRLRSTATSHGLGALTTMLDATSLILTGVEGLHPGQAKVTFAMARHAAVDLAQVVQMRATIRMHRNACRTRIFDGDTRDDVGGAIEPARG